MPLSYLASDSGGLPCRLRAWSILQLAEQTGYHPCCFLHAPNDKIRNQYRPVSRKYPSQDIVKACRKYTSDWSQVTYEYLLQGMNIDSHAASYRVAGRELSCQPHRL